MTAPHRPIAHPWSAGAAFGETIEVAEGVLWARLPLPMKALPWVNVYALDDGDGWTLVDTGMAWETGRKALAALREGPLGGRPVTRVILTHHHPDHIGLAGPLAGEGAEVLASRVSWLMGRMMTLDARDRPDPEEIAFRRRAGVTGAGLEAFAAKRPFVYADMVAPVPLGFRALEEGAQIEVGGRRWTVRLGHGHAPHHTTLWSEDGGLMIAGDQVLPGISSNIGVYATEPEADPLSGWLDTCRRFSRIEADPLVLPGHKLPFRGLHTRLAHLVENHVHGLDRLEAALAERPARAADLFSALYHRPIGEAEFGLALVETVAHLNHLHGLGRVTRSLDADGAWLWRAA